MLNFVKNFKRSGTINRILMTGAGGQVGQVLLPYLNEIYGNNNVLCTDVVIPTNPAISSHNKWLKLDILDKAAIKQCIQDFKPDQIIHFAALLSALSEQNPHLSIDINIHGFQNMIDIAADRKIKFFSASSIAAFGPSTPRENTPNECIMKPTSIYGISKVYGELIGSYFKQKFGLDFRSLRYPIVVSPIYAKNGSAAYICQIFFEAIKNKKYDCYLQPHTKLPFIYIDDVIEGTLRFLEADKDKLRVETYNQGGTSFTPKEMADIIQKYIPNAKFTYHSDFRQAVVDSWPKSIDSTFAKEDWNWEPRFGIKEMAEVMMEKVAGVIASEERGKL